MGPPLAGLLHSGWIFARTAPFLIERVVCIASLATTVKTVNRSDPQFRR